MTFFGDFDLAGSTGAVTGGASFGLLKPATEDTTVDVGDWEIEVKRRSSVAIARCCTERQPASDGLVEGALAHLQPALDRMCVRGSNRLSLRAPDDEYLVWHRNDDGGLTIRVVEISNLSFGLSARGEVVCADGQPEPESPPIAPEWHESFRYFRLSQTTDELLDAYRNAYLALEAILSDIEPQQRRRPNGSSYESEKDWLRRAVKEADRLVAANAGSRFRDDQALAELVDDLYLGIRAQLAHAKLGRDFLLPHASAERAKVLAGLRQVLDLYLAIARVHLHVGTFGGGVTTAGWRLMFSALEHGSLRVSASDDESAEDPAEESPNPRRGTLRLLRRVERREHLGPPFVSTWLWSTPAEEMADLPFVRRLVATHDGTAAFLTVLQERLRLGRGDVLEYEFGSRGLSSGQPRQHYPL